MKALKWILWIAGGLVVLLIAAVAIIAATFDPNAYKPQIVDLVKKTTGRTLTMDGKIGLAFFPKIGAEVEKVTLSEPASTTVFVVSDWAGVTTRSMSPSRSMRFTRARTNVAPDFPAAAACAAVSCRADT